MSINDIEFKKKEDTYIDELRDNNKFFSMIIRRINYLNHKLNKYNDTINDMQSRVLDELEIQSLRYFITFYNTILQEYLDNSNFEKLEEIKKWKQNFK